MIIRKFESQIKTEVPIIDIEIGNDISDNWDYTKSDIITLGILEGNNITIIQREKTDNIEKFKEEITKFIEKTSNHHALNFKMEQGGFFGFLGKQYPIEEVKPWSGKGSSKNDLFNEVLKLGIKIKDKIICPLNNDSRLCISKYKNGEYEDIIGHNLTCLLKEAYILKHKKELQEKFKNKIDSSGWWIK